MTEEAVKPWYRQPWLWFLLAFPLASITWCTIAITVAMNTENAMVTDDYSKEGRGINMQIARDQKAKALGLQGEFAFSGRDIRLTLSSSEGQAQYPYLILNLFHPTIAEKDQTVQFTRTGENTYRATLNQDVSGRWYFDLRSPENDWRLKGETSLPSDNAIQIGAASR
ncbi:nitrogen fixation protein FixH [Marinobacter lipolyticus]|uniref:FixH family protein n=1 Tax=Marinobacter lipolyticus TaxID=209639 RepID=UPI001BD04491|nr:FixH family protein [Marinobacter lipolyticus]MBS8241590.1 nitrogen fixation protein FixH [Marinobacter lipolyticus]